MLDQLIGRIPKPLLVFLILAAGTAFVIFSEPPISVCDVQTSAFKEAQDKFLFSQSKTKNSQLAKETQYDRLFDYCQQNNSPGGCLEFFRKLKLMTFDVERVSLECKTKLSQIKAYKSAVWDSLELLVRLAWGAKPPETYHEKLGWLSPADLNVFCRLKDQATQVFSDQSYAKFQERMLQSLPGQEGMPRDEAWRLLLLSVNCRNYQ